MKIIALNIRHGGGKRVEEIIAFLRPQEADAIVLTEFRVNHNARVFRTAMASQGLENFTAASISPKENTVAIFAKRPFTSCTYSALATGDRHRLVSAHFETFAIYGVYFSQNHAKASLFRFLLGGGHRPTQDAYFVIGDFNTGLHQLDETGGTFHCADEFAALSTSGLVDSWRTRNPGKREYSWYSHGGNGFRIDHVFASPLADARVRRTYYDHTPRESRATDHSALVLEMSQPTTRRSAP